MASLDATVSLDAAANLAAPATIVAVATLVAVATSVAVASDAMLHGVDYSKISRTIRFFALPDAALSNVRIA